MRYYVLICVTGCDVDFCFDMCVCHALVCSCLLLYVIKCHVVLWYVVEQYGMVWSGTVSNGTARYCFRCLRSFRAVTATLTAICNEFRATTATVTVNTD